MKKIFVDVSKSYNVIVEKDSIATCGKLIREVKDACTAVIISDDTVYPLYGETVEKSLKESGFSVLSFVFAAGERSKNLATAGEILQFLAENKVARSDVLVALGGGVVGDMVGFCASVYLRSIPYVQIPTTVLAAVDSSVGGKTGIDLSYGKNLVGSFYHPLLVVCDTDVFSTLSREIYTDGLCEVIKYGCILDKALFDLLAKGKFDECLEDVVARCIELKADIVSQDEFDNGIRQILNYGHTMGHAIEALSDFSISHGRSVAAGMVCIEKAAGSGFDKDIKNVLDVYDINVECPYTAEEITQRATNDKKIKNGALSLILLKEIGKSVISPMPVEDICEFFAKGVDAV